MIYFQCDYEEGCHPAILKRLNETNLEQTVGYSMDPYCASAREKIKKAVGRPDADVHFLVGGTQTNMTVIAAALKPWQGAICADTGHIACHETGAVEATGHKVLALSSEDGKITAAQIEETVKKHYEDGSREHIVQPGMVYISFPTESGTLYSKQELTDIYAVCKAHDMPLFIDGARLGYGLQSPACDVTLPELANLCDVFYIGGTKVGAMFGEAVVFTKQNAPRHFLTLVKQKGALLAKGWLLGLQFDTLFTDELYWKISRRAIETAELLKEVLRENELPFYLESPTNQQFVVLENEQMEALKPHVAFSFWEKLDEKHTVVRFATSWATTKEEIMELADLLKKIRG